jgi:hypothetical protein
MPKTSTHGLLCAAIGFSLLGFSSPPAATPRPAPGLPLAGQTVKKDPLPDDLPQAKLLFIKFTPVTLAPEGPKGWGQERRKYFMQKNHNKVYGESNKQLMETARRYPYAYRITTLDSVVYYHDHGYKYMLMQTSFNAAVDGSFVGTTNRGTGSSQTYNTTSVGLYVEDLNNGTKYFFEDFSETFIYYYQGQEEMLLKKISKQFKPKK